VRLVDDLLDISRITRDRLELRLERAELGNVIAAALETVQPLVFAARQQVRLNLPSETLPLLADTERLAQVFANLLSNATKFSDMGANIDVEATVGADTISVTVRDNGIGLREDQLTSIFDMFAQADNSLERTRSGLGIGLTLARRLVEMHGGKLTANSAGLGRGSEFTVSLPLVAIDACAPPEVSDTLPVRRTRHALRVLVVDDNKDSADMLALSLKMMGHDVISLYDPLAVLKTALDYRPDLAFMDVGMPVLNGFELAKQLRAQRWPGNRCPRLVALTGWGQDEDRHLSAQAGFGEHLVKPANLETIERVCRETIATLDTTRTTAS